MPPHRTQFRASSLSCFENKGNKIWILMDHIAAVIHISLGLPCEVIALDLMMKVMYVGME